MENEEKIKNVRNFNFPLSDRLKKLSPFIGKEKIYNNILSYSNSEEERDRAIKESGIRLMRNRRSNDKEHLSYGVPGKKIKDKNGQYHTSVDPKYEEWKRKQWARQKLAAEEKEAAESLAREEALKK